MVARSSSAATRSMGAGRRWTSRPGRPPAQGTRERTPDPSILDGTFEAMLVLGDRFEVHFANGWARRLMGLPAKDRSALGGERPPGPWMEALEPLARSARETGVAVSACIAWPPGGHRLQVQAEPVGEGTVVRLRHAGAQDRQAGPEVWRRAAMEQAPDQIMIVDRAGIVHFINRTRDAYPPGVRPGDHLVDAIKDPRMRKQVQQALESAFEGRRASVETRLGTGPSTRWHRTQAGPLRDGDGVAEVMLVTSDLTERRGMEEALRESEERFRTLTEHAGSGIIMFDHSGRILYLNPAAKRLFGRTGHEAVGLPVDAVLEGLPREPDAVPREALEASGVGSDGRRFPVECSLATWTWQGAPAFVAVVQDASVQQDAQKARLAALQQKEEMRRLQDEDRFRTRFMNMVAHEMNTPLTPIKLQLHMLKQETYGALSKKGHHALEILERNIERANRLANDLLEVSRLQAGKIPLHPTRVDLERLIGEAVEAFRPMAEERGMRLEVRCPSGLHVNADAHRTSQVLYNLLSNAIKFTPEGGQIHVSAAREGEQASVTVQDTGLGLEPHQQEHLFEPFSRAHEAQAGHLKGTGMGLYISKVLVERQGGTLGVHSKGAGRGSAFTFTLPCWVPRRRRGRGPGHEPGDRDGVP